MYQYNAHVTKVVDGDTFKATVQLGFGVFINETFRLLNIDTPETFRPKSEEERERGNQAKDEVKRLIEGKDIVINTSKTGKYGRWLAEVKLPSGVMLAEHLKQMGLEKRK